MIKLAISFVSLLLAVQFINAHNIFYLRDSKVFRNGAEVIIKSLDDSTPVEITYDPNFSTMLESSSMPLLGDVSTTQKPPTEPFIKIGSQYYIIHLGKKMSWFEAADTCLMYNAELASIESDEQLNALSSYIAENDMGDSFWISANDIAKEGQYYWGNTGNPVTYAKWNEGEPNNIDEQENCVHLRLRHGELSMNDVPCDTKIHFICTQKLETNEVASPSKLFTKLGSKYYMVVTERTLNWFDAQHVCRSHHARLTDIESEQELETLSNYLYENGFKYRFWFSANDLGKDGDFYWSVTGKRMTYANWQRGQPDNHGRNEDCVHLYSNDASKPFVMNDLNCDSKMRFICEFI